MRATARLRTLLDGLLIAASLLFLGWATVLGNAFDNGGASSTLQKAICLAYPLGDIVAGTIVLVLLTRSRGRGVVHLSMIAAAVFSLLLADLGFAYAKPARHLRHRHRGRRRLGARAGCCCAPPPSSRPWPSCAAPTTRSSRPSPGSPSPTRRWSWPPSPP
jgi:hypothetical protein